MLTATGLMLYNDAGPVTPTGLAGQATFMLPVVTAWKAFTPAFGQPAAGLMFVARALIKAWAVASQPTVGSEKPAVQVPRAIEGTGGKLVLEEPYPERPFFWSLS
jgi:hypothetical protein